MAVSRYPLIPIVSPLDRLGVTHNLRTSIVDSKHYQERGLAIPNDTSLGQPFKAMSLLSFLLA